MEDDVAITAIESLSSLLTLSMLLSAVKYVVNVFIYVKPISSNDNIDIDDDIDDLFHSLRNDDDSDLTVIALL